MKATREEELENFLTISLRRTPAVVGGNQSFVILAASTKLCHSLVTKVNISSSIVEAMRPHRPWKVTPSLTICETFAD